MQLPELVILPPAHSLYNTLFALVMNLLQDPVASVRTQSFKGVAKMIKVLKVHAEECAAIDPEQMPAEFKQTAHLASQYVDAMASAINALVSGETYQMRQLWVELARQLLCDLPKEIFVDYFIDGILILTSDSVSNVRVAVSVLLASWAPDYPAPQKLESWNSTPVDHSPWTWLMARLDIQECVRRLSKDDNDVYLNISKLANLFPEVEFVSISCRGRKFPPGGSEPVKKNPKSPKDIENESLFVTDADVDNDGPDSKALNSFGDINLIESSYNSVGSEEIYIEMQSSLEAPMSSIALTNTDNQIKFNEVNPNQPQSSESGSSVTGDSEVILKVGTNLVSLDFGEKLETVGDSAVENNQILSELSGLPSQNIANEASSSDPDKFAVGGLGPIHSVVTSEVYSNIVDRFSTDQSNSPSSAISESITSSGARHDPLKSDSVLSSHVAPSMNNTMSHDLDSHSKLEQIANNVSTDMESVNGDLRHFDDKNVIIHESK